MREKTLVPKAASKAGHKVRQRTGGKKTGATPLVSKQPAAPQRGDWIVSSAHLMSAKSPELSEFEFGMIIAWHAFSRWMMRCMGASGAKDMAATDILVLHHVNHRNTEKRLADICFVLNIEDTHVVTYALKKLVNMGWVKSTKHGKEVFFSITDNGRALCQSYRTVREACLMPGFSGEPEENKRLAELARTLRTVSGRYDQAARAATAF